MRRNCQACEPYLLPDPRAVFEELDRRRLLVAGPDLVIVTRNGSGDLQGSHELPALLEEDYLGDQIARAAVLAGAGDRDDRTGAPDRTAHLVRRRRGRTVPRPHDLSGWNRWLNAGNGMAAAVGDWFLVTEHGWRSLLSHSGPAGSSPRLRVLQAVDMPEEQL